MKEEKNKELVDVREEISDNDLELVSGGVMQGNIIITETTPISEDTKENI